MNDGDGIGTFTDERDGQTYKTVKIGNQVWMAENLRFNVGDGCWCYQDNEDNCKKYGRLYTWDAAKKACPAGYHLPSREEWAELVDYAGGKETAGKKLKSKSGWDNKDDGSSGNGTDEYGFSALPSGIRAPDGDGFVIEGVGIYGVEEFGKYGQWWVAAEHKHGGFIRGMSREDRMSSEFFYNKSGGLSVRCVGVCPKICVN
jgi:uncharacterized protein (TIGR02145 family)